MHMHMQQPSVAAECMALDKVLLMSIIQTRSRRLTHSPMWWSGGRHLHMQQPSVAADVALGKDVLMSITQTRSQRFTHTQRL